MIVYLDQNFISNIAKAWLNRDGYEVFLEFYLVLKDLLERRVVQYPASYFHFVETDVDIALACKIEDVVKELSRGLLFMHWKEVLRRQILNFFYRFIGRDPLFVPFDEAFFRISDDNWKQAYPFGDRAILKNEKVKYVEEMEKMREDFRGMDLYELASRIKDRLIEEYVFESLSGVGDRDRVKEFANSYFVRGVPFIDIYASLSACLILYDSNRHPKGSDRIDLIMTSTVLPYVDVFATDRYIKNNLVSKLHFDRKYNVSVFSGKVDDVKTLIRFLLDSL